MRKTVFAILALLLSMAAEAKNITIVIRGTNPRPVQKTEVTEDYDTIKVTPAMDVSNIYIMLKKTNGTVVDSYCVPATSDDRLHILTPEMPEGYLLEIKDDKGLVYKTIEY